jgi:cytochrome c oxidase assembly protein subunit 15
LQTALGALVAGLRAGRTYNTWPLMDGRFIPDGLHLLQPWWLNHLENVLTVQFQHRMGAYLVAFLVLLLAWLASQSLALRPAAKALAHVLLLQFALGVATLLTGVNLWLASAHQLVALAMLALLLRLLYLAGLDSNQHTS